MLLRFPPLLWQVELEDLTKWEHVYCNDRHYKPITLEESRMEIRQSRSRLIKRPIKHPFYKNIDYIQTQAEMKTKETGSFLFRPSSGGLGKLSMTIKLASKPLILMNEQIEEHGREKHTLSLGKPLTLTRFGGEEYVVCPFYSLCPPPPPPSLSLFSHIRSKK